MDALYVIDLPGGDQMTLDAAGEWNGTSGTLVAAFRAMYNRSRIKGYQPKPLGFLADLAAKDFEGEVVRRPPETEPEPGAVY